MPEILAKPGVRPGRSEYRRAAGTSEPVSVRLVDLVAPGDPVAEQAEVVVRAGDVHGEQAGADVEQRLAELVGALVADGGGALDLARVAADRRRSARPARACLWAIVSASPKPCQMFACWATSLRVFFSPPPPISTGMSRVGFGLSLAQRCLDPRQRLAEGVQPAAGGTELVAVLVVVALEPARTDAEDQPAVADVVDGAGHVGEQVGVAVGVAGDQRADLDPLGRLGPGARASSSTRSAGRPAHP